MANGNHITVTGNLTRDPELRYVPSGAAVAKFGVAVNRRWQNKSTQEWEEEVSFFNVVAWSDLGENVAESFSKGDRVIVDGRLDQRSWETDDGQKRDAVEITADDVAASTRFATVDITRREKGSKSNGQAAKPVLEEAPF